MTTISNRRITQELLERQGFSKVEFDSEEQWVSQDGSIEFDFNNAAFDDCVLVTLSDESGNILTTSTISTMKDLWTLQDLYNLPRLNYWK